MGKNQWVSPREGGKWAVHGEGSTKDTKIFDDKKEAIKYGKQIAENQGSELIVQNEDGKIASNDNYGADSEDK